MSLSGRDDDAPAAAEELIERVLRAAGPRRRLPAELAERWQAAFTDELVAVARRRRRRFLASGLAVAASVALAAIGVTYLDPEPQSVPAVLAKIVHAQGASADEHGRALAVGQALRAGSTIRTRAGGYVGLSYRGADIRIAEDSRVTLRAAALELAKGRIYVDAHVPLSKRSEAVVVQTRWGTVSHVGTQFVVETHGTGMSSAVRQGTIELRTPAASHAASAHPGQAAVLSVDGSARIAASFESVASARWQWIGAATPGFAIAGRNALEVLEWASRETGRELVFASQDAEARARAFVLGSNADVNVRSLDDVQVIVTRLVPLAMTTGPNESIHIAVPE